MAAVTSLGESPLAAPAKSPRGMQGRRRRRLNLFRYVAFTLFGLFFLLPLLAMLRFSLEGKKLGTWSAAAWTQIVSYPGLLGAVEIKDRGLDDLHVPAGHLGHRYRSSRPVRSM
jgi:hypothetical protein